MKRLIFLICLNTGLFLLSDPIARAQFPPPAGQPGTTAMFRDSSAFVNWATGCTVVRGYVNISDTSVSYLGNNRASYGSEEDANGFPDDLVVSLGDGGSATLTFEKTITNGPGPDFAVFENALTDNFLELGFVEVSSDGQNFFRFPAVSLTQTATQVASFGSIDAFRVHHFAGKYRAGYGTPFDLDSLKNVAGLNVNRITHVRIIDVVGCIQPAYSTHDTLGNEVNDPWPTPFNTCGFDLDAIGVIHESATGIGETGSRTLFRTGPNPVTDFLTVRYEGHSAAKMSITNPGGNRIFDAVIYPPATTLNLSGLKPGLYFCTFRHPDGSIETAKLIKQ